jgi:CHAT domain-containing protein
LQKQLAEGTLDGIRQARQDLLALRDAIRECPECHNPDFLPQESTYQNIIESPAQHQALIYISATEQGGVAFVIPPAQKQATPDNRDPIAIPLAKLTEQLVDNWLIRRDENRRIVGGYQFAVKHQGAELLRLWTVYSVSDQQEYEQRLATQVRDLPVATSAPFTTLQAALKNTIEAWQAKADELSKYLATTSQNEANNLYALLSLSLQDALAKGVFSAHPTFHWFLLEAELELLQHELGDTFMAHLRQELDNLGLQDPDQPIALIPCGRLGMLPLHAAWVRSSQWPGTTTPFAETCELTYQASARSLATAREAVKNLTQQGPVIAIGNPRPTKEKPLEWATAEAQAIASLARYYKHQGTAIVETEATRAAIEDALQKLGMQSGAWIHLASHGKADPTNPENCFMLLGANEPLTLAELQKKHFPLENGDQRQLLSGIRGFIASGCYTALGDLERAPDELISFAAGTLQAGAPCAIATFWTVRDVAQFLLMLHFMSELLRHPSASPARALREAARWMRTLTHEQLGELAKKGLDGFRSMPENLTTIPVTLRGVIDRIEELASISNDAIRLSMKDAFPTLLYISSSPYYIRATHPFEHASCWAAAVMYGA